MDVDVCLKTPLAGAGASRAIWDAFLEYDNERIKSFGFEPGGIKNCGVLRFKPPDGESIHQAILIVNGVSAPPDMVREKGCKEYLSKLQQALDKKYFGVWVVCNQGDEGDWYINYLTIPFWMSDFDARWLIQSDELYTIKGNWSFNLTLGK